MWLFLREGFASIVANRDDHDLMVVGSRARVDLERICSSYSAKRGKIIATPDHDHLRFVALKSQLRAALEAL